MPEMDIAFFYLILNFSILIPLRSTIPKVTPCICKTAFDTHANQSSVSSGHFGTPFPKNHPSKHLFVRNVKNITIEIRATCYTPPPKKNKKKTSFDVRNMIVFLCSVSQLSGLGSFYVVHLNQLAHMSRK